MHDPLTRRTAATRMRRLALAMFIVVGLTTAAAIHWWPEREADGDEVARAVPAAQSAAARALRLPRMHPSASRAITPADQPVVVDVHVLANGPTPRDSTIDARAVQPACDGPVSDTLVARTGDALQDVIVWVEGTNAALVADAQPERRPAIRMEGCRLLPRLQVAAPRSVLQLVMRDSLSEQLVVVPSAAALPVDTITFLMDGQLVPVRQVADSAGMVAIYATRLPWARAFVAVAAPGAAAITDGSGKVRFTLDGTAGKATIRAWHPSLGVVAQKVTLTPGGAPREITLTFRR